MDIQEITVQTDKLAETKRFYTEILELKITGEHQNSFSFAARQNIKHS